jgi:hypothetical protein
VPPIVSPDRSVAVAVDAAFGERVPMSASTVLSMSRQLRSDMRQQAVVLALGRMLFGIALVVAPSRMAALTWGARSPSTAARLYARGGGVRDIALGAATAVSPTPVLLWMSAACDGADSVVTVLDGGDVPRARRAFIAVGAGVMAAVHATLAAAASHRS